MPLYRCTISEGLTTYDQRLQVAKEITKIHCEVTGAPPVFVHAFFVEDRAGMMSESTRAIVIGSIRAGRSDEQKERIVSYIKEAFARVCGVHADQMMVALIDVPARWVMEGGAVLPEPGEESGWLEKHAVKPR